MPDQFGATSLPIAAGGFATRLTELLAFARAVIVAQVQTAWASAASVEPNEVVAAVFAEDPRKCVFSERVDLPALFAFEAKGAFDAEGQGDGFNRSTSTLSLWWLFPPSDKERKRPLDRVAGDIARALAAALRDARHPSYVHASDEADPDAVKLPAAAPLVGVTYSGATLDGAIGDDVWPTPGRLTITTTAGAWNTTDPITVTISTTDGTTIEQTLYLESATGPETVINPWIGDGVVSIEVPDQPSAAGTLAFGVALAPGADLGSSIREKMGVHALALRTWERGDVTIETRGGAPPQRFDGVRFDIAIEETRSRTGAALDYDSLDPDGSRGEIVSIDGGVSAEVYEV